MAVRETTLIQHRDIQAEFNKLTAVQEYGVQKYSTAYILRKVAAKYYKSAKTVENIVFGRTYTAGMQPSQTSLNL